jgi:transcriptional regulator of acetoin/glycerol metabolism
VAAEEPEGGSPVDAMWKRLIVDAPAAHGGNIKATARELEISRATLYARMKQYGTRT